MAVKPTSLLLVSSLFIPSPNGLWAQSWLFDQPAAGRALPESRKLYGADRPLRSLSKLPTSGPVWSLSFSPSGDFLSAALGSGRTETFAYRLGILLSQTPTGEGRVLSVASTSGDLRGLTREAYGVAMGGDSGQLEVIGTQGFPSGEVETGDQIWGLAFSPDGNRLAAVGHFLEVLEYDLTGLGKAPLEARILAGSGPCHSDLRYSPDGSRLYLSSALDDPEVRIRILDASSATKGEIASLRGHTAPIRGLDLSADGRYLITGSYDRSLRIWDLEKQESRILDVFQEDVNAVAISPDGALVAAGIDDGTLAVYEIATEYRKTRYQAHRGHISAVAFSRDGEILASGGKDEVIRLLRIASLKGRPPGP